MNYSSSGATWKIKHCLDQALKENIDRNRTKETTTMKVINLYGGPGTGKSTTAADLFALMKWKNMNVELVNEYAKELAWEKRFDILEDQLYITAKQNRKLTRINNQVEWAITDSPLLLALAYAKPNYLPNHFRELIKEVYDTYNNINILLIREKPYHANGRYQSEEQARSIDGWVRKFLTDNGYPFYEVPANEGARQTILDIVEKHNG
jgi:nicotinamide riboside kinase